jgi:uncharacterized membrane protein
MPRMENFLFHPKVVHVPMALGVLMPLVAAGLLVAWWRGWLPRRAFAIAVALQAILFASGLVAMRSGESEEDRVEKAVPEAAIEAHEEAAEVFVWAGGGVLAVMGLALVLGSRAVAAAATAGTLVVLALGVRTGQAGGSLVYEHGAGGIASASPARGGDHDDD